MADANENNVNNSGAKKKNWFMRHKIITVILALILLISAVSASGGGDDTSTTPANETDVSTGTSTEPAPEEEAKSTAWNLDAAYAKVKNGMTKAEVEKATGKQSDSCTESEDPTFGKTEICSYGNAFIDKGAITVTYSQDKVSSKTKSTY